MNEQEIEKAIIKESINSLQTEGLRFSVDTLAKRLKISKKTVYKYFSTKEELAVAVYNTFYENCYSEIIIDGEFASRDNIKMLLNVYYKSFCMVCDDIFNKYALNEALRTKAKQNHEELWNKIVVILRIKDDLVCKTIIDGAFEKMRLTNVPKEKIIEKIEAILC